ncbi:MotA/TolQ/ExbB proton channel [Thermincola ferriacetica]|uniref:MotA/TolQ/ExbB proton channel n=2 Tax=Thermincola TaxID=278993 RepID=D5XCS6_THEPJ|nr:MULTISPECIES: flagellar motor protein [Thermincola]ADG83602.1 MotA/TolQ/ExbB proton channel [Thermincola potens JR]KNZ70125.1 MotA/TolQ/ExbB proton channel [Thermincola ferriacetica]
MDLTSILGIIFGLLSLVGGFVAEKGHVSSLLAGSAALIVFGGTIGATVASFKMEDIKSIPALLRIVFKEHKYEVNELIVTLVGFAEKARREGLLSLERETANIEDDFLRQGIQLVVDGTDPALVRDILETQIEFMDQRHKIGADIFESAGGYAPTMGIIGTVMGLVHVLGNLSDPESLGPAIASAFIATLYGVSSANILWLPMGHKLKLKSKQERFIKEVALEGILSIQAGDNPSIVGEKLRAFLSAKVRKETQKEV